MRRILVFVFLIAQIVFAEQRVFDPTLYSNFTTAFGGKYRLHWKVEEPRIYIGLEVQTKGWIGFGIGEPTSGSMPGADILTGYVTPQGASIQDRNAMAKVKPEEDSCSDWELISGTENDDWTFLEVARLLGTGDAQDRPIVPGKNRVIFAFGDEDDVQYHGSNRVGTAITFLEDTNSNVQSPTLDDGEVLTEEFRGSYTIQKGQTQYVCTAFELPSVPDKHIIQIDALIDPVTSKYVHHFLLHQCNHSTISSFKKSTACGLETANCKSRLWAWAPGMDSFVMPADVGLRMSNDTDASLSSFMMEIHYDNPDSDTVTHADTSGVRFHYTEKLRKHDMGVLMLGDPLVSADPIAPGLSSKEYEFSCPTECTTRFEHEIHVFSHFAHMHMAGSQIWTSHWRGQERLDDLHRIDFWDFGFQQATPMNVTIKPGDSLNHHCVYNTKGISSVTKFGQASSEEMCMAFVSYYPKLEKIDLCGYVNLRGTQYSFQNVTVCGELKISSALVLPNPSRVDPAGGINKKFGVPCAKEEEEEKPSNSIMLQLSIAVILSTIVALYLTQ